MPMLRVRSTVLTGEDRLMAVVLPFPDSSDQLCEGWLDERAESVSSQTSWRETVIVALAGFAFWVTPGRLRPLDNAPTHLAFLALAQGLSPSNEVVRVPHVLLEAISVGAVFMRVNTYIGNAPNFMLKSLPRARRSRCHPSSAT